MTKKYLKFEDRHRTQNGVKQKKCSGCEQWKPLDAYYGLLSSRDGRVHQCKSCSGKYGRKFRQDNPNYTAEYRRRRKGK